MIDPEAEIYGLSVVPRGDKRSIGEVHRIQDMAEDYRIRCCEDLIKKGLLKEDARVTGEFDEFCEGCCGCDLEHLRENMLELGMGNEKDAADLAEELAEMAARRQENIHPVTGEELW